MTVVGDFFPAGTKSSWEQMKKSAPICFVCKTLMFCVLADGADGADAFELFFV